MCCLPNPVPDKHCASSLVVEGPMSSNLSCMPHTMGLLEGFFFFFFTTWDTNWIFYFSIQIFKVFITLNNTNSKFPLPLLLLKVLLCAVSWILVGFIACPLMCNCLISRSRMVAAFYWLNPVSKMSLVYRPRVIPWGREKWSGSQCTKLWSRAGRFPCPWDRTMDVYWWYC